MGGQGKKSDSGAMRISPGGEMNDLAPAVGDALTVLLPVRNGEKFIERVIADIAPGLLEDDELLVLEDGSSDTTPMLLTAMSEQVPQLRVLPTNGTGLVNALNLGISEASWPWIARADADDRYPPDRLAVQRIARAPGVAAITGDYRVIGPVVEGIMPCALGPPFVALSLVHPQRFPHPGVMFRRDAVLEAGGYRSEDYPAEDLGLWMRLAQVGDFIGVAHIVVDWRMNPTSITHTSQAAQRAMTHRLLEGFSLPRFEMIAAHDVEVELYRYDEAEHTFERAILLARDLWAARRLGVPSSALRLVLAYLGLKPGSSLQALRSLNREVRSRREFRESISK